MWRLRAGDPEDHQIAAWLGIPIRRSGLLRRRYPPDFTQSEDYNAMIVDKLLGLGFILTIECRRAQRGDRGMHHVTATSFSRVVDRHDKDRKRAIVLVALEYIRISY